MNLWDGYRSLSDSGRHPFHRPRLHVAGREHAGQAGFQRKRYWLARFSTVLAGQVAAGQDEPVPVARNIAGQPVGVRGGADHHEQRRRRHRVVAAGGPVAQDQLGEPMVAAGRSDLGVQPHMGSGGAFDLCDE